jgi:hypothetical protein
LFMASCEFKYYDDAAQCDYVDSRDDSIDSYNGHK